MEENKKLKVLSLFDGMSCGQIALNKLGLTQDQYEYYASEIKPHGIKVTQTNYPNTIQIGDVTKVSYKDGVLKTSNGDFNIGDIDVIIGGSPCFVSGTKVITDKGFVNIEDIKEGDLVLTHKNRFKKVLSVGADFKTIFKIKGRGFKETGTTANHPYYVRKGVDSEPQWIEASKLEKGDYLGIPINNLSENKLELTKEECYILGRYIADGHTRKDYRVSEGRSNDRQWQLILSVGEAKVDYIKDIIKENKYSCYPHSKSVYRVVFSSKRLVELAEKYCGIGAKNKVIPQVLLNLPVDYLKEVLKGFMDGDGSINGKTKVHSVTSISEELIMSVNLAVLKVHKVCGGFYVPKYEPTKEIEGRTVNQSQPYMSSFRLWNSSRTSVKIIDDIMWVPFKKVEEQDYKQTVFNIEVEDDNSYTANSVIVHNCQNFSIICKTEHRLGLEGIKSNLFFHYLRIMKEVNPKYFLLENVASMKDVDKDALNEYMGCTPIFVDSKEYSPQIRKRYYWTNIFKEGEFKVSSVKNNSFSNVLVEGYTHRDKALCLLEGHSRPTTTPYRMMRRHSKSFSNYVFKDKKHYEDCVEHFNNNLKGLSAKEADEVALRVDISVYNGIRNLYPIEMERLQTVPEGYTSSVSENESASLLGDGWTVDVIVDLLKPIVDEYKNRKKRS